MPFKKNLFLLIAIILLPANFYGQDYIAINNKCSEVLKDVPIGDSIFWDKLNKRDQCLIGEKAPFFVEKSITNEILNSEKLKGKVLFLNFWFTSCKPCIKEMPLLNKIVQKFTDKEIMFISFANDDKKKLENFLKSNEFNFKIIPKSGHVLVTVFKLFSLWPTSIIIDKNGVIQFINKGEIEEEKVITLIESLLE